MKKEILNAEQKFNIGGQAVIEGVMFRGKNFWSVAVRREDGSIKSDVFPLNLRYQKSRISKLPFFRGVFILMDSLYLGYKALEYSAANAFDENVKIQEKEFGFAGFFAAFIAVVLFVLIPLFATKYLVGAQTSKNSFLFSLIEGFIRLSIFIFYLLAISISKDIQRVFAYHGAEHMVIHAFEHEGVIDPKRALQYSPLHLSCGTSFIVFVLLIMIVLHAFIKGPLLLAFAIRLLLVPVVAGISYEFVRFARRHEEFLLVKILSIPGLLVQKLTTRKPDLSQLEVASHSLKVLLDSEKISYKATSI